MLFSKIFACASVIATAIAQSTSRIAFTVLPQTIQAGQDITLHWGGGDGSPVTLTLQQGTTQNLQTVELLTGSASGYSYTFKVPTNLPNADNYAFRIQQGDSEPNYTGMIALIGGTTTGPTNAVSAMATSAGSASSTASAAKSSITGANAGGAVIGGSHATSSASNATMTVTATSGSNATAVANSTTAAGGASGASGASAATGTAMHRNTTMSMATLSSSSGSETGTAATTTGGSGSTGTSRSTAPTSSPTGAATYLASNLALLVCAFAGVVYLG